MRDAARGVLTARSEHPDDGRFLVAWKMTDPMANWNSYLNRATRDILGGAAGGLLATTSSNEVSTILTSTFGVLLILAFSIFYFLLDYAEQTERDRINDQADHSRERSSHDSENFESVDWEPAQRRGKQAS